MMSVRPFAIAVALASGLAALQPSLIAQQAAAQTAKGNETAAFAPFVTWSGPDSCISTSTFTRATNEAQWQAMWAAHIGAAAKVNNVGQLFMPKVNFDRCMVVAAFRGDGHNSNGYFVVEAIDEPDRVVLRLDEQTYQTAGPDGGAVKVRPYGIFVLPRSNKSVVIEENVQGIKDRPATWKERAKL
jgi:hypothetical protein